jgi:poly-gamma-glutamate synthesis protein (capsule biosynthesis protein)
MAAPSAAVYRRRRVVAVTLFAVLVVGLVLVLRSGGEDAHRFSDLTPAQVEQVQRERQPIHLTLSVSGDLLIHSPVWERAAALAGGGGGYDFAPLFDELRPYVRDADLAICHVETPMTSAAPTSYPIFNTPPDLAKGVAASGWDACDTASNHSLDQGQEGINQTGAALARAGVEHTGSFPSAKAQKGITMLESDGVKIAFLAYTTDTNGIPAPSPWSVNIASPGRILEAASAARKAGADAVIVNTHWGGQIVAEYQTTPSSGQVALVKKLLASKDVTAVVGQGPHVVQPIERIDGKYVVFSEGNLISNQGAEAGLPEDTQDGYVALLDLVVDGHGSKVAGVRYVPTWVEHPDYTVLPVGDALDKGEGDAATLKASYDRTVGVVGHGKGIEPVPDRLR